MLSTAQSCHSTPFPTLPGPVQAWPVSDHDAGRAPSVEHIDAALAAHAAVEWRDVRRIVDAGTRRPGAAELTAARGNADCAVDAW